MNFGYQMLGFGGHVQATPYDPGMMTFDGSTGYYDKQSGVTTSGNKFTFVARFNIASFAGGASARLTNIAGVSGSRIRVRVDLRSNDYATTTERQKLVVRVQNSSAVDICYLVSSTNFTDNADHVMFFSFDGDVGTAVFRVDSVDEDDTGAATRTAPTTGTLGAGDTYVSCGANHTGSNKTAGDIGYFGYHDVIATWSDFMSGSNPLELDQSGWSEWITQPLFFNEFSTMDDNKGSAGNMTENGTITGPS